MLTCYDTQTLSINSSLYHCIRGGLTLGWFCSNLAIKWAPRRPPTIRIFVSNTLTTMSLLKDTSCITRSTAVSNSSYSPSTYKVELLQVLLLSLRKSLLTTNVSNVSISVKEKLQTIANIVYWMHKEYSYFPSASSTSPREGVTPRYLPWHDSGISSSAGYACF
jgi:hypothetical protein